MPSSDLPNKRQLDLICDFFEEQWSSGALPDFRSYLDQIDAEFHDQLLRMLLEVDVELRQKASQTILPADYAGLGEQAVQHVDQLINTDSDMTIPPDSSVDELATTTPRPSAAISPRQIGPYKLLQQIGEGGMGSVWMAEQEQPVRRRVALKLIKAGMADKQVIARFEAERQALSMMDHPNIAKVLDAGMTKDGRPYFAMELVQGIPFTEYCDSNRLKLNDRLELFVPVCQAIQHAHQKGIIHRDLKPSNVLVTLYDGSPVPKVIDFGLAKALQHEHKLTDRTMFTEFGQVVGTLQYMSPEQAEMNALDVDTRTDIYSLGVMLYELLTGSTPLDKAMLQENALLQVIAIIKDKEPPRPSTRLSESGDAITGISQQRKIAPSKLQQILRGELDWIVMKALEKDRTRRYETANGFAADIRRYLEGDAVVARPPSTAYRFSKFVRKNRSLVATATTIVAILLAGIVGTSYFAFESQQSAMNAKRAADAAKRQREIADEKTRHAELAAGEAAQAKLEADNERRKTETTLARSNYHLAVSRWNENRVAEAIDLLCQVPPRHRNVEWSLAWQSFKGTDKNLYGHGFVRVTSVQFSPNGTMIVSSDGEGKIKFWDSTSGEGLGAIASNNPSGVTSIDFNSDGSLLASAGEDNLVTIWDVSTKQEVQRFVGHSNDVKCVRFSPDDSKLATGSVDATFRVWDVTTGEELHRKSLGVEKERSFPNGTVNEVDWHPNGGQLITVNYKENEVDENLNPSGEDQVCVWDAKSYELVGKFLPRDSDWVRYSPDGQYIAASKSKDQIGFWDVTLEQQPQVISGATYYSTFARFSPCGSQLVVCDASFPFNVRLCEFKTGKELRILKGHSRPIEDADFSPDGSKLVTCDTSGNIKIWDIRGESSALPVPASNPVLQSGNPRLSHFFQWEYATSDLAEPLRLKDLQSGKQICSLQLNDDVIQRLQTTFERSHFSKPLGGFVLSPSGQLVAAFVEGRTTIWLRESGKRVYADPDGTTDEDEWHYDDYGLRLHFSSDSRRLASINYVDNQCRIRVLSVPAGELVSQIFPVDAQGESLNPQSLAFSPNGNRIAIGYSNGSEIEVWDIESGTKVATTRSASNDREALVFTSDGSQFLSAGDRIRVWDSVSAKELRKIESPNTYIRGMSLNHDTSRLFVATNDGFKIFDFKTGEELCSPIMNSRVNRIHVTEDNHYLIAQGNDRLNIWPLNLGRITTLVGRDACFSPDGKWIASKSDQSIELWDSKTGNLVSKLEHGLFPYRFAFSTDSKHLFSTAYDASRGYFSTGDEPAEYVWSVELAEQTSAIRWQNPEELDRHFVNPLNGSWLRQEGKYVIMESVRPKISSQVKAFRQAAAQIDKAWHRKQAQSAERDQDWSTAMFHWSWFIDEDSLDSSPYRISIQDAYDSLREKHADAKENAKLILGRSGQRLVEKIVAFEQKELEERSRRFEAYGLYNAIWNVAKPRNSPWTYLLKDHGVEDVRIGFDKKEVENVSSYGMSSGFSDSKKIYIWIDPGNGNVAELIDKLCHEWPRNSTFLTARAMVEYASNQYEAAIQTVKLSIQFAEEDNQPSREPIGLAIIAMCHHQLGERNKAIEFRNQLDEKIEHETVHCKELRAAAIELIDGLDPGSLVATESDAGEWNAKIWEKAKRADYELVENELDKMRTVCNRFPKGVYFNTLATMEYRFGNFEDAISAALISVERTPKEDSRYDSPFAGDFAILAMSYFKLNNNEKANVYRDKLKKAMKLDEFKDDEDCLSFLAEVNELFDAPDNEADD